MSSPPEKEKAGWWGRRDLERTGTVIRDRRKKGELKTLNPVQRSLDLTR